MKWGVRRYQNKDGTLTSAGKKHDKATRAKLDKTKAKKIAIGALATATVATAAVLAVTHREQIENAVNSVLFQAAATKSLLKEKRALKQEATKKYVSENKNKILEKASLTNKYRKYLTDDEINTSNKHVNTMNALHQNHMKEIRRGADYINSIMTYVNTANTLYNLSRSPLVNELKNKKEQNNG